MALEAGGLSEKFGNRYEANWVAKQLLRLLEEKISSITVEPIGNDEVGVDVIIENLNGDKEFHQCKASNADSEYWTISKLNQSGILSNAWYQIQRGMNEFHLVSPLPSKNLSDLSDSARNTTEDATDFYEHQIESQKRKKDISNLCNYLDFDCSKKDGLNNILLFLQRFKVIPYGINKHSANDLEDKTAVLFSGEPNKLLSFLKNYPVESNRLRTKITTSLLLEDLKGNGFQPRIQADDNRISPVIKRISEEFTSSIEPYLISNSLINRPEVTDIINALDEHAVILIKSEAGMGKSAVLLDLHQQIQSNGVISVPIRLDRNRPDNNADSFGCKLGFLYSPVLSLSRFAANQKTVIILDQLDAIRWTAAHSNNALQVCQELVRQVLNLRKDGVDITVILACRKFDLDEDVALNSWISSLDNVFTISLSFLNTDTVTDLISPYEQFNLLSSEKQKILTIPLWLGIYLVIANRDKAAPQFTNKLELVKKFWDDRLKKATELGINEHSAKQLIEEVVVLMNSKSRLAIPGNNGVWSCILHDKQRIKIVGAFQLIFWLP